MVYGSSHDFNTIDPFGRDIRFRHRGRGQRRLCAGESPHRGPLGPGAPTGGRTGRHPGDDPGASPVQRPVRHRGRLELPDRTADQLSRFDHVPAGKDVGRLVIYQSDGLHPGTPRRLRRVERARQCRMGLRQRAALLHQGRAQQPPRGAIPWHRRPTACRGSVVHPRAVARLGGRRRGMGPDPQRRLQRRTPDRCGGVSGHLPQRPPLVWCRWVFAAGDAAAQPRRAGRRPRDACSPRRQPGDGCLLRAERNRDDRPCSV